MSTLTQVADAPLPTAEETHQRRYRLAFGLVLLLTLLSCGCLNGFILLGERAGLGVPLYSILTANYRADPHNTRVLPVSTGIIRDVVVRDNPTEELLLVTEILANLQTPVPSVTGRFTAVASATPAPVLPSASPSRTVAPSPSSTPTPSSTPSAGPGRTFTPQPTRTTTRTATATATRTPILATVPAGSSATPTAVGPVASDTPTVPPTLPPTVTPSFTSPPTATDTPIPPSDTPVPTDTQPPPSDTPCGYPPCP